MAKKRTIQKNLYQSDKHTKHVRTPSDKKRTHQSVPPESYDKYYASWKFQYRYADSKWDIGRQNWLLWDQNIIGKLKDFEKMTWAEIKSAAKSHGDGSKSHHVSVQNLCDEAKKELKDRHLYHEQIFSLRLTAKERIYGFLENGVLGILWYDEKHEIYPLGK